MGDRAYVRGVVVAQNLSKAGNRVASVAKTSGNMVAKGAKTGFLATKSTTSSGIATMQSFFNGLKDGFSNHRAIK